MRPSASLPKQRLRLMALALLLLGLALQPVLAAAVDLHALVHAHSGQATGGGGQGELRESAAAQPPGGGERGDTAMLDQLADVVHCCAQSCTAIPVRKAPGHAPGGSQALAFQASMPLASARRGVPYRPPIRG